MIKTFAATIPLNLTSVRRLKNGKLRVTLDIEDANVFDTSRLLAEIGKQVSVTIEGKDDAQD